MHYYVVTSALVPTFGVHTSRSAPYPQISGARSEPVRLQLPTNYQHLVYFRRIYLTLNRSEDSTKVGVAQDKNDESRMHVSCLQKK
jgi:hypothetical protein